ncbi:MAG: hypothetical protein Q7J67_05240 [bacterium]|nr:hypothetical protein [bacterium]
MENEDRTAEELMWECKYCGQNEKPKCIQCVRKDGLVLTEIDTKEDCRENKNNKIPRQT